MGICQIILDCVHGPRAIKPPLCSNMLVLLLKAYPGPRDHPRCEHNGFNHMTHVGHVFHL